MEVQQLVLHVSDRDLNEMVNKFLPRKSPVRDLRFETKSGELTVSGEYPLFIRIKFSTSWEIGVQDGKVTAKLLKIKAMRLPVTSFKSKIMKIIREGAGKLSWLSNHGDTVIADVDRLAAEEGLSICGNLKSIECSDGMMLIFAGTGDTPGLEKGAG